MLDLVPSNETKIRQILFYPYKAGNLVQGLVQGLVLANCELATYCGHFGANALCVSIATMDVGSTQQRCCVMHLAKYDDTVA